MTATIEQAIAAAVHQSTHGPAFGVGECQKRVRLAWGVPSDGTASAAADWHNSRHRHATTDAASIPRGALVRWVGGSHGYGHVAIATGDGRCWSTDIRRPGWFDLVPITEIHARWGLTLVGWTEDIDGVTVWHKSAAAKIAATDSLVVALGNFCSNPVYPAGKIKQDMKSMFSLHPDVTLSCEVAPASYRKRLRKVAHHHGHDVYGIAKATPGDGRTENPITIGQRLAVTGTPHTIRLSNGRAKITPDRDMTIVRTHTPAAHKLAFIGAHLVSEAWTHQDATTAWRRATWNQEHDRIKAKVAHLHQLGWTVIVGGDLNHPDPVTWHKNQVLAVNRGLMQLAVIPAHGITAHVGALDVIGVRKLTTDHPIIAAPITLTAAA
jgi:hypothetical protein